MQSFFSADKYNHKEKEKTIMKNMMKAYLGNKDCRYLNRLSHKIYEDISGQAHRIFYRKMPLQDSEGKQGPVHRSGMLPVLCSEK